ncbi:microtubule binding protein [Coniophora puteana RWD-64-598 SS2]|uniref:Microtubule binding protein n=1 Tax=Coniophora puteana (strain RWD-64-598) TaxID=741705 RepID=A0A5M3MS63_CONPW|nr:microtubule binding protein [Coniophora puteana RWD-64-598 SS2]EIW81584.1 microtubule binding protein [Coniophora puteana RWD-64-598 SS2]
MSGSRTDLLAWLNELLQINYTKVEQCGTGAAYCQVLDSIFLDVPMSRVKMNAKHEYEFIANFKVLQNAFKAKKIDKPILVERLVKCKMQDNLEFLQWMKRFWDSNYGGHEYDPVARRRGAPAEPPATIAPIGGGGSRAPGGLGVGGARSGGKTPVTGHRAGSTQPSEAVQNLQAQLRDMSTHMEGLEKERDFYFAKLRDIEILVQQQIEALEAEGKDDFTLNEIQKILYSTEDGFEVPENAPVDEEETF